MKTHLILTPALVALALTSLSTLPAFAEKNNGAFQKSAEGMHLQECSGLHDQFSFYHDLMNRFAKGSPEYKEARKATNDFLGTAWEFGCNWAQ